MIEPLKAGPLNPPDAYLVERNIDW